MRLFRLAFLIFPLLLLTLTVFAGPWVWPSVLPSEWSLRAAESFLRLGPRILRGLGTSLGLSFASVLISLALSLPAARAFFRKPRPVLEALFLLPILLPPLAYASGLQSFLLRLGLEDSLPGTLLALTSVAYPYLLRCLLDAYRVLDADLLACAENLGARGPDRFFRIELPLLAPALVTGSVLVFLASWSDYLVVFLVGGGLIPAFTLDLYPVLLSSDRALSSLFVLVFMSLPLVLWFASDLATRGLYRSLGTKNKAETYHV